MMCNSVIKKGFIIKSLFTLIFLQLLLPFSPVYSTEAVDDNNSALLLYGGGEENIKQRIIEVIDFARIYSRQVGTCDIEDYKSELLSGVKYILIIGSENAEVNEKLGQDLKNFKGKILWIGGGIEKYYDYGIVKGFKINSYSDNMSEVRSSYVNNKNQIDRILTGQRLQVPRISITDKHTVNSFGTCIMGNEELPLAINSGNVWCFSFIDTKGEISMVFKELFNLFFDISKEEASGIYIKLNNISPFSKLDALESTAAWLNSQGVPFIMELRPVFVNTDFKQMQKYTSVVKEMQHMGGTPVMGNLQRWRAANQWDQSLNGNSPLSGSEEMVPEKLMDTAVRAYVQYGIYPIGFSAPIDALFDSELNNVLKHFSLFISSGSWQGYFTNVSPGTAWQGTYMSSSSIPSQKDDTSAEVFQNLTHNTSKPQAWNSILEFNSDDETDKLKAEIEALRKLEISVLDIRDLQNKVDFENLTIRVKDREILINGNKPSTQQSVSEPENSNSHGNQQEQLGTFNKRIKQTMTFVLVIVGVFIIAFILAFIVGKGTDRRKHLR